MKIVIVIFFVIVLVAVIIAVARAYSFTGSQYRLLRKLRQTYLASKTAEPAWSDEYRGEIFRLIIDEENRLPNLAKDEVIQMTSIPEYYGFYFDTEFTLSDYRNMRSDYQSGVYSTVGHYSLQKYLEHNLPIELRYNQKAVRLILKAIQVFEWFDKDLNISPKITKNQGAVAARLICNKCNIKRADALFAGIWGITPDSFRKLESYYHSEAAKSEAFENMLDQL